MGDPRGIFQGDFVIETAIRAGIADILANPWVLDYVFRGVAEDELTQAEYGSKLVKTMTDWITKVKIPVFVNTELDPAKVPAITINLIEDAEDGNTHSDRHYDPTEVLTTNKIDTWPPLTPMFQPDHYDFHTGKMTLPTTVTDKTYIFPGMIIETKDGRKFSIVDVSLDQNGQTVVTVDAKVIDWAGSVIKAKDPQIVQLESAWFRCSYLIGCHVNGESWQLSVLYSLVKLALSRGKEDFLIKRGYEVSSISGTDFSRNRSFAPEQCWSRYINLTGKAMDVWPQKIKQPLSGIVPGLQVIDGQHLPADMGPPEQALWSGDEDFLNLKK